MEDKLSRKPWLAGRSSSLAACCPALILNLTRTHQAVFHNHQASQLI